MLKIKFKKLMWQIKLRVSNLIYRFIKKPIQDKKEKILIEKAKKELIKKFETSFNVNHKEILMLNNQVNSPYNYSDKQNYLKDKLKEGAKAMVSYTNKSPMFYEPDIINIHNDFNELKNSPTIKEIMNKDSSEVTESFHKKEYEFYRENYPKEKRLKLLSKKFGV